jgi:hypothetical protein
MLPTIRYVVEQCSMVARIDRYKSAKQNRKPRCKSTLAGHLIYDKDSTMVSVVKVSFPPKRTSQSTE